MGVKIPVGYGQWTLPLRLSGDSEEMVVTCGFLDDDTSDPNAIANTITNALFATSSFAASTWSTIYTLGPGRVTVNRTLGTFEGVATVTRVGTNAAFSPTHQNTAVLCRKITSRGGRRGRGRMYLPVGLTAEGNITPQGGLLESVRATLQADLETWKTALIAASFPLQLLHGDKVDPETGEIIELAPPPNIINTWQVDPVVATQRTRMRR